MNKKQILSIATVFLLTAIPAGGSLFAQGASQLFPPGSKFRQDPAPPSDPQPKTFSGKITKSNGQYFLEDSMAKTSYLLDDQKTAKKYDGKSVLVTGTLNADTNTLHVQKIQASA